MRASKQRAIDAIKKMTAEMNTYDDNGFVYDETIEKTIEKPKTVLDDDAYAYDTDETIDEDGDEFVYVTRDITVEAYAEKLNKIITKNPEFAECKMELVFDGGFGSTEMDKIYIDHKKKRVYLDDYCNYNTDAIPVGTTVRSLVDALFIAMECNEDYLMYMNIDMGFDESPIDYIRFAKNGAGEMTAYIIGY